MRRNLHGLQFIITFFAGTVLFFFSCTKPRTSPEEHPVKKPRADFSFEIIRNTFPVQVAFTNKSERATSSFWSFGNGHTSTITSPVDSFAEAGKYQVKLVATNAQGSDSIVKEVNILEAPPEADFDFTVENPGQLPCNVIFQNKSVGATSYMWSFAPNDSSSEENTNNKFTSNGVFAVRLIARNAGGADTAVKNVRIAPKLNTLAVYLVTPRDKSFNQLYYDSVKSCVLQLQQWYKEQMLNNRTFEINPLVVDTITGTQDSAWYNSYNGEFSGTDPRFYGFQNTLYDMGQLLGDDFDITKRVYLVYVAAAGGGAGYTGFCALGDQDLKGLLGINPDNFQTSRWIGGAGHEVGHAFGLPHPDNQLAEAIMWTGYLTYPNCILQQSDRNILNSNPLFK